MAHYIEKTENLTPFEAFQIFYEDMNRAPMSESEEELMVSIFRKTMEDGE